MGITLGIVWVSSRVKGVYRMFKKPYLYTSRTNPIIVTEPITIYSDFYPQEF